MEAKAIAKNIRISADKHNLNKDKLYVKETYVNEGPVMKRMIMDSRGHVGRNDRRTSHVTVVVSEK